MNAFDEAKTVEMRGMAALMPYIKGHADDGQVVLLDKGPLARFLQETIGDLVFNRGRLYSAEVKVEQRHTGNLFLETWSNKNLQDRSDHATYGSNPGWLLKTRADLLLYYFLDTDDLYVLDVFKLKRWAFGTEQNELGQLWQVREKRQGKYNQRNDTWGRCVSVRRLHHEVGLKHVKVKQLGLWEDTAP